MARIRTRDPGIIIDGLKKHLRNAALAATSAIYHRLTAPPEQGGTPVKTGHASSNWIPSEDAPVHGVVGSPQNVDRQSQQQALSTLLASYAGGNLFIVNNVSYIESLNNGSSSQAPSGFVQAAVAGGLGDARRLL